MTERLYYDDAYLWEFDGTITCVRPGKKQGIWEAALDRSAFYPTSGGQPFDTGKLAFSGGEANVIFGGRLGEYRYYDMDQVIAAALALADRELR